MTNSTKNWFTFNTTTVIAIIAGGVVAVILIIVIVVILKRRRKSQRPQSVFFEDEDMGQMVAGPLAEYRALERQSVQVQIPSQHSRSLSLGPNQTRNQIQTQKIGHQKSQSQPQPPVDFRISIQPVQPIARIAQHQSLANHQSSLTDNMTMNRNQRSRLTYIPYIVPPSASIRESSNVNYSLPTRRSESSETLREESLSGRDLSSRSGSSRIKYPGNDWH